MTKAYNRAVYVTHLSMTNFRNYRQLELEVPSGLVLLQGANAQGKTNFLEALYILATSRSPRTTRDREIVAWHIAEDDPPVARFSAHILHAAGEATAEIYLMGNSDRRRGESAAPDEETESFLATAGGVQKRIRVNGVPRRAVDLLGTLRVVLFRPEDLELVSGPPAGRRRTLDILLAQIDRQYTRVLQRYGMVLKQRNHLLRRIAEGVASSAELAPWDESLSREGAYLLTERQRALDRLSTLASECNTPLSNGQEKLEMAYQATITPDQEAPGSKTGTLPATFQKCLQSVHRRDIAMGQTTIGPHRDDLALLVNRAPAGTYGSRGQQRTVALAWKLAEARYLREVTGEDPVVLLDDALSELDAGRRQSVLETLAGYQQVFLTTTGAELVGADLRPAASFLVQDGQLISNAFHSP